MRLILALLIAVVIGGPDKRTDVHAEQADVSFAPADSLSAWADAAWRLALKDAAIDPRRLDAGWERRDAPNSTPNESWDFAAAFEFPIQVLANGNTTAQTSVVVNLATASVDQLYLHLNNVAYNGKGRVRLDNGTAKSWITFSESDADVCAFREAIEGCFANNSNRNHRALFDLPSDWTSGNDPLQSGNNTLVFEMVIPASELIWIDQGHGYRVRWLDFVNSSDVTQSGPGLVSWYLAHEKALTFDNVSGSPVLVTYGTTAWRSDGLNGKLGDVAAAARGEILYASRDITDNRGREVDSSCQDCHFENALDFEIWQIETPFCVETGLARGLTQSESEDLCAYIRSQDTWTVDGTIETARSRPWCEPYQPGNSMITGLPLSQSAAHLWPLGSCFVAEYDSDTHADFVRVANNYDPADPNAPFRYEDIPISLTLPSYHAWLPIQHINDISGGAGSESSWGPYLDAWLDAAENGTDSQVETAFRQLTNEWINNWSNMRNGSSIQERSVNGLNGIRTPFMKYLEGMIGRGHDHHDVSDNLYDLDNDGTFPGCRAWPRGGRTLFEMAGHLAGADGPNTSWLYSPVGDKRAEKWGNHSWYQGSAYANYGCHPQSTFTGPVDWGYQTEFFTHSNTGYRFLGNTLLMQQFNLLLNSSGGLASESNGLSGPRGFLQGNSKPFYLGRDLWLTGNSKSRRLLDDVSTAGLAVFYTKYFEGFDAMFDAYRTVDSDFSKTCDPFPGQPYVTDTAGRAGGYGNTPCVDRGGDNGGKIKRWQWPAPGFNAVASNFGYLDRQGGYTDTIFEHLKRANDVPGFDKSVGAAAADHFDDLLGSGNLWRNLVSGDTGPPPVTLTVSSPSGGQYEQGEIVTISVSTTGTDSMLVALQKNSVDVEVAADSVASNNALPWTLASDLTLGTDYRFRVSSASGGGITAFSGLFEVTAPAVVPQDSTDATIGHLNRHYWSGSCDFDTGDRIYASGDFATAQPNDNGCAWMRRLHSYRKASVDVDALDMPTVNSTVSHVFAAGTDSTSRMVAIDLSAAPESDSIYVRLSARIRDGGPRRYVSPEPIKIAAEPCLRLVEDSGTIYGEYDVSCTSGWTRFDSLAVSWTPVFTGIHANSRTGVAGAQLEAEIHTFRREH